jgi:alpha-1,6-mannosyltransferase
VQSGVYRAACLLAIPAAAGLLLVERAPPGSRGALYILTHLGFAALMCVACRTGRAGASAGVCLAAGIAARLLLIPAEPFTSNDVYRYLWDGHALLAGADPWRLAPAGLAAPGTSQWPLPPDNTLVPTIYPPLAVLLFGTVAATGPLLALWVWKGLVTAASALTLWVVHGALEPERRARALPLVALNPLLILEAGVGAHLDVLVGATVVIGLVQVRRGRVVGAGAWLAAGVLIKLVPLVLVLPIAFALGRQARGRFVAAFLLVVLTGYGAVMAAGLVPLGSLPLFLAKWRFAGPLHGAFEPWLGSAATRVVAVGVAAGLIALALAVARARRSSGDAATVSSTLALGAPLLASPAVFPWYFVPLASLAAFHPTRLMWVGCIGWPLTYEVVDRYATGGGWSPSVELAWGLGALALIAAVLDARRPLMVARGEAAPSTVDPASP